MTKIKLPFLSNDLPRNIAVNCLLDFERVGTIIQDRLHRIFETESLPNQDRRLATELALGACRQLITLDHLISRNSNRPVRKIDPIIRQILRVGLYQMIYTSNIPDFAAVDQAVSQAKQSRLRGADGFVNAVLRAVQKDINRPITSQDQSNPRATVWLDQNHGWEFKSNILPDPAKNLAKHLSLAYSYPPWLMERWAKLYDPDILRTICLAGNSRPRLTLRINPLRSQPGQLAKTLTDNGYQFIQSPNAIQFTQHATPEKLPGYTEGLFAVQDLTAMQPAAMLNPQPGETILDLCAAPGGKTTQLAERMNNTGSVLACDITPEKLERIDDNCRRLGISIVQIALAVHIDPWLQQYGLFDAVLVDAPCSNTGVLARRVEARHRLKPADVGKLAKIQLALLNQAVTTLKPAGRILYSTCSIDPGENQLLIEKFLADHPDFNLADHQLALPNTTETFTHDGGYTALLIRSTSE